MASLVMISLPKLCNAAANITFLDLFISHPTTQNFHALYVPIGQVITIRKECSNWTPHPTSAM